VSYNLQTSKAHLFTCSVSASFLTLPFPTFLQHFQRTLSILHSDTERREKGASLVMSCHILRHLRLMFSVIYSHALARLFKLWEECFHGDSYLDGLERMMSSHDTTLMLMMLRSFGKGHGWGLRCACDLCSIYTPLSLNPALIYHLVYVAIKSAFSSHLHVFSIVKFIIIILKYLPINQTVARLDMTFSTHIKFFLEPKSHLNLERKILIEVQQHWQALSQVSQ
jgi:hypothetical protein